MNNMLRMRQMAKALLAILLILIVFAFPNKAMSLSFEDNIDGILVIDKILNSGRFEGKYYWKGALFYKNINGYTNPDLSVISYCVRYEEKERECNILIKSLGSPFSYDGILFWSKMEGYRTIFWKILPEKIIK